MRLLKATTIEGKREFFNLDKIMTLQENADGTRVKIFTRGFIGGYGLTA